MGPAGSGKGTMSDIITDEFPIIHISTGDMLRAAINKGTEVGKEAKQFMDEGKLVPDLVILKMVEERLNEDDCKNGFLFDGFPRTLVQAKAFDEMLLKINKKVDAVINLTVEFSALSSRITGRRVCKNCGAIYHVVNQPPIIEGICNVCGSELFQRSDDTIEQLTVRLEEYNKLTKPVLTHYEKQNVVKNINASQNINEVYADVKKALIK
jgi:adenylate kinase